MRIEVDAVAGTLESSDALVRVSPAEELRIEVTSTVEAQFGAEIRRTVAEQLDRLGVTEGLISVQDKGALDFVIRARVQGAVLRGAQARPDWRKL
ncbi:citrate lyase acyl carrier protein [Propioniciclava tarda]|uniref:Citrate lyase acyl carrier protein n=1 Tax=Propioniciclava tarda TaxID=433330 RepID=A0A4Q9KLN3_PROTD|nr:citrate lyase acyl carrier protein [Propioniciclava tarda]TBT94850.1 citrate lyase acyl carrier protein [Propioniciclava tarda]SMO63584.1 citrate lyase subunit gamma (acyl carrier protein) [Propioniciclava tarda]HOA89187.1 citrate lyase acyl carrier protein [Propioniciclava tarda]HQA32017.1 citrate lyase acyl carrier protein [Propioniciclava tarda]HQD61760.1 citrate lyase acyl carrier protein [Propioniciclava tarda]